MIHEENLITTEDESARRKAEKGSSRRAFLGQVGAAATLAAGTLASPSVVASQQNLSGNAQSAALPSGVTNRRIVEAFELRVGTAARDSLIPPAKHTTIGVEAGYADNGGTYT